MKNLKRLLRNWGFLYYCFFLLLLFLILGGGLKTTSYVLAAAGMIFFLLWRHKFDESREIVTQIGRGLLTIYSFCVFSIYFYTETPNEGLNDIIATFFSAVVFIISAQYYRSILRTRIFFLLLTIFAFLGSIYGIFIYIIFPFDRLAGPFIDLGSFNGFYPNAWANFVLLAFPAILYLFWEKEPKYRFQRIFAGTAMVFLFVSFFLTYSRGAFLIFGLTIFLMLIIYLFFRRWHSGLKRVFSVLLLGALFLLIASALVAGINYLRYQQSYRVQSFVNKVTFTSDEKGGSISERAQFFDASMKLIKERPFFGYGPYSFPYVYPAKQSEFLAFSDHPHNWVYKYALERGLIVLGLFFMFVAVSLAVLQHGLFNKLQTNSWGAILMIFAALFGLCLHNLIDYNLNFLSINLLTWQYLGMAYGMVMPVIRKKPSARKGVLWYLTALIILICVVIAGHEGYYGYSLRQARLIDNVENKEELSRKISFYEESLNLWQTRDVIVSLIKCYFINGDYDKALLLAQEKAPKHKYYAELWYYWGELLYMKKDFVGAKEKYLYALKLDSKNEFRYYLGLYKTLLAQKEIGERQQLQKEILNLLIIYKQKIKDNIHFTVLTLNPLAAIELNRLLGRPDAAREIEEIYVLELDKLKNPTKYSNN